MLYSAVPSLSFHFSVAIPSLTPCVVFCCSVIVISFQCCYSVTVILVFLFCHSVIVILFRCCYCVTVALFFLTCFSVTVILFRCCYSVTENLFSVLLFRPCHSIPVLLFRQNPSLYSLLQVRCWSNSSGGRRRVAPAKRYVCTHFTN